MSKLLSILVITMLLYSSCKQEDLALTQNESGELSVQLNDASGQAIAGTPLSLFTIDHEEFPIEEIESDANGLVNFGKVNPGYYTIEGQNINEGDHAYSPVQRVQIVAAEKQNVSLVPSEYSASIVLSVTERKDINRPLASDVKVALFEMPNGRWSYNVKYNTAIENIVQEYKGDGKTKVFTFDKVPLSDYGILVYTDASFHQIYTYELSSFKKGDIRKFERAYSSASLRPYLKNQLFEVTKREVNAGTGVTETVAYAGCKILILTDKGLSNMGEARDFETVSKHAFASTVTESTGQVNVEIPSGINVQALYYGADNSFLAISGTFMQSTSMQTQLIP